MMNWQRHSCCNIGLFTSIIPCTFPCFSLAEQFSFARAARKVLSDMSVLPACFPLSQVRGKLSGKSWERNTNFCAVIIPFAESMKRGRSGNSFGCCSFVIIVFAHLGALCIDWPRHFSRRFSKTDLKRIWMEREKWTNRSLELRDPVKRWAFR